MEYDVAVIGGGPAGAACAWKLSLAGARTILVDRARFPREKACGGALGWAGARMLHESGLLGASDLERLVLSRRYGVSCYLDSRLLRSWTSRRSPVLLLDRKAFDAALLARARDAGADVVEGDSFEGLSGDRLLLRSGREIRCGRLVGADGADSAVARAATGRRHARGGFGIEYVLPLPGGLDPIIQIHFGLVPYGYGWIFPREDSVLVGVGSCERSLSPAILAKALRAFASRTGFGTPPDPVLLAAPLPSQRPSASLGGGDVYLAGDAAGLVDRVSGEGISLALESGLLVAEAIAGSWTRSDLRRAASRGCVGRVRQSALARHLLYHPLLQGMAMSRLAGKDKFYEGYWGLISGEAGYGEMLWRFLRSP